jgi:hypothetical protein
LPERADRRAAEGAAAAEGTSQGANARRDPDDDTGPSQRAAAVDKMVVVIGIQTRTKQPQVNGIDVDGDYNLSDKKVVARGVLRKTVVAEEPTLEERMHAATRGAGTFYAVIDPETKQLAKTKLAE